MSYTPLLILLSSAKRRRRSHHVPRSATYNNFASWIIVDMSSIMLMRLQELCKNCVSLVGRPVILFYCTWANLYSSNNNNNNDHVAIVRLRWPSQIAWSSEADCQRRLSVTSEWRHHRLTSLVQQCVVNVHILPNNAQQRRQNSKTNSTHWLITQLVQN